MRQPLLSMSSKESERPSAEGSSRISAAERCRIFLLYAALGLPLLVPMFSFGLAIWLSFHAEKFISWEMALDLYLICTFLASMRAYTPRWNQPPSDNRPASTSDQPMLWEFVTQVAMNVSADSPDGIIVNSSSECHCYERYEPLRGLRSRLIIGQWIFELFTLSELKALLAIRLSAYRGTPTQRKIARLTRGLELSIYGNDRWTGEGDPIGWCFRLAWYVFCWPIIAIQWLIWRFEYKRIDPLEPDRVACSLAGTDATMLAIVRADTICRTLKSVEQLVLDSAEAGFWSEDVFSLCPLALRLNLEEKSLDKWVSLKFPRTPALARDREWFELGAGYISNFWEGFPEGDRREENARKNYVWIEPKQSSAICLIESLLNVRKELTYRFYNRLGFDLYQRHTMPNKLIERWLTREETHQFPASVGNFYDHGRLLDPEINSVAPDDLEFENDSALFHSLPRLYQNAGKLALRWSDIVRRLEEIDSKTTRTSKDEIQFENLQKARRELIETMGGHDRRLFAIHIRLAKKTNESNLLEKLEKVTRQLVLFQKIVASARRWDRTLRIDCELANDPSSSSPNQRSQLILSFEESRERMTTILEECRSPELEELSTYIECLPLHRFLRSLKKSPSLQREVLAQRIEKSWLVWREFRRKADWLHRILVEEMLRLSEQIVTIFEDRFISHEETLDTGE